MVSFCFVQAGEFAKPASIVSIPDVSRMFKVYIEKDLDTRECFRVLDLVNVFSKMVERTGKEKYELDQDFSNLSPLSERYFPSIALEIC